ncbi:glutamyl-Q tRNA(Asp) synthetase [Natronospira proteinivora]|uniref:Glutamyl-Q tRNA(Asp) synthetase n=1 Tax=Natronospira proteinivora TaxID=1807133 RepID=A0ABT1G6N0_9GAMM|nr:tRNA glutamyl-Q(34) synthetase GluQRS [Natronospira proteinivora]MCP1726959.1 glutamyl-Q tRNA(Asp) synthetase [Natronospira proteinivora]
MNSADPHTDERPHVGRFAPSPTGPLHFGSLLAATASYLQAHRAGGQWRLRIEDIDPPREQPGAREAIPAVLSRFGFAWDGPIQYQSDHLPCYQKALEQLLESGWAYPCACTRREVREAGRQGPDGPIYPGTCRQGLPPGRQGRSIRLSTQDSEASFQDSLQGRIQLDLERDMGDFVIRRADGLIAYHLAAAVDDGDPEITHVVRGIDLLYSTPRQIWLMQCLGLTPPRYAHIPVALSLDGQKLSKQTGAQALDPERPSPSLHQALQALGQAIPPELQTAPLDEIWDWAHANWDPAPLKGRKEIDYPVWEKGSVR